MKHSLLAAFLLTGCETSFEVTYECSEPTQEEVAQHSDQVNRCVEAGGRGIRSTEDWVTTCQRIPFACKKELTARDSRTNGIHIPCRVAGPTTGLKECQAAGWKPEDKP